MTENRAGEDKRVITIAVADSMDMAIAEVLPSAPETAPLILPSSGSRQDPSVAAVRHRLRSLGVASSQLVPGGISARSPLTRPEGGDWIPVDLTMPGQPASRVSLPARLVTGSSIWIVSDVNTVAGRGPHVLDLADRYLRLSDRLRMFRYRDRSSSVALAGILPIACVISTVESNGLAIATISRDLIAGELAALSLAELRLPPASSVTGVWEDSLIQFATDLELGVPYPGQIAPIVAILTENQAARALADQILTTMGIAGQ